MKKINYTLNEQNVIIGWHNIPFDETKPYIEIADDANIIVGVDKIIDGKLVKDAERATKLARIAELKSLLTSTDYQCLKHADGELTDDEYAEIKAQRHTWRVEINELEN